MYLSSFTFFTTHDSRLLVGFLVFFSNGLTGCSVLLVTTCLVTMNNEWPVLVFSISGAKPRTRTHDKDPKSVCADRASRATNAMPPSSCGGRVRLTSWLLEHAQIEGMSTHAAAPLDMAYVPPLLPSPAIQTTHVHGCLARTRTNEPCLIAEIR